MLRLLPVILILLPIMIVTPFSSAAGAEGSSTYAKNCASCHGQDGTAATPIGTALKIPSFEGSKFDAEQIDSLLRTSESHASLQLALADRELNALVEFLDELAAGR